MSNDDFSAFHGMSSSIFGALKDKSCSVPFKGLSVFLPHSEVMYITTLSNYKICH